ncbi:Spc97 / Spc98 family protein [Histomonas meleagridis]|uniref:Spc97 / Spc98 family protein n=1 Tax=Histomonas meleagridis TaxID=135588 RepID=UPI00355AA9AB|nr:Spc97 / Spc98 family protein [Histomonas meleagridis]KAH0801669.1 Spc97 / Spc98 family protein [Histomonas meleagridis]
MVELVIPDFLLIDTPPVLTKDTLECEPADLSELPISVEEKALISDLFYCLIGCDGIYIKRNENGNFKMASNARESATNFIEKMLPSCDNFLIVQKYSESHLEFKYGRTSHALCAALRTFLHDYIQQIADLEVQPNMTLSLLLIHLQIPAEILKIAATLVKKIQNLHGTQITIVIYKMLLSLRGNPHLNKFLSFLFNESIQPLLEFIDKWVFLGEVDDPHNEFFIRVNRKVTRKDTIPDSFWDDRYSIIHDMVPNFIPRSVIDRIFSSGKSQSILSKFGNIKLSITRHLTFKDLQFESLLTKIWKISATTLINLFVHEHRLLSCLGALKDVFLCQRGDWLSLFLRAADSTLRKPREQITPQDFEPYILAIFNKDYYKFITASIEQDQLPFSLQVIHSFGKSIVSKNARKAKVTSSKSLWEYFTFKPKIPEPLNLLFTEAAQQKYTFLFRHMLLWRRLEQKFCHDWKLKKTIKEISVARHSMHVFITAYLNFMTTIIVHPYWSTFEKQIQEVDDIEHLCSAHEQLLQQLIKGCFILNEKIYKRLTYISTLCWHFAKELKKWNRSIANEMTEIETMKKLAEPVLKFYERFKKAVKDLIQELTVQAERDVDQCYLNFVLLCITVNPEFQK